MFAVIDKLPKTSDPTVFGPHTWAYLHISTAHLPEILNPLVAKHIKNSIIAVPLMVPCEKCTIHMGNYIDSRMKDINKATTGSELFKITIDMHNFVNKRLGRAQYSYDDAYKRWKSNL